MPEKVLHVYHLKQNKCELLPATVPFAGTREKTENRTAYLARIQGRTRSVNLITESLGRVMTAGHVGITGIVRSVSSGLEELISAGVISSVATSSNFRSAIQNKLDRKVDVITLCFASNLDAISKRTETSVSPAGSTILRNVLVQTVSQIRHAVNVPPRKRLGKVCGTKVGVRQRRLHVVVNCVFTNLE
jgi:hypothetical protein